MVGRAEQGGEWYRRALPAMLLAIGVVATSCGKDAKTFSETQQFGADTFSDYKHASGKGPRMPVGTVVQVDCLAVGPEAAAPSVHGNWYHVVGPDPYTGFYIAANTFLNGDNPNTPLSQQHARDERLPLCAGSEQTA